MRIGELAEKTGVSARSLRHYEKHRLLLPRRTEGGYRDYDATVVQPVLRIRWLLAAGFNMRQIRMLLPCINDQEPRELACATARMEFQHELVRVRDQMRALRQSERLLQSALGPLR